MKNHLNKAFMAFCILHKFMVIETNTFHQSGTVTFYYTFACYSIIFVQFNFKTIFVISRSADSPPGKSHILFSNLIQHQHNSHKSHIYNPFRKLTL